MAWLIGLKYASTIACLCLVVCGIAISVLNVPSNFCRMTYMRPNYLPIDIPRGDWGCPRHYSLLLYREGWGKERKTTDVKGMPVLYIPGNAGSGRQVRSLAAQAADDFNSGKPGPELDFFAVDFDEEFTAMSGPGLAQQVQFVGKCVAFILSKYSGMAEKAPKSVILVGHSMGGLVARGVFLLPAFAPGTVKTVLTVSSPHSMPAYADAWLRSQLDEVNRFWRQGTMSTKEGWGAAAEALRGVHLVSIATGRRDLLVPTDSCDTSSFCPPDRCLSLSSTSIGGVFQSIDHQASVWCNQLVAALVSSLRRTAGGEEGLSGFEGLVLGARSLEAISYMRNEESPKRTQAALAAGEIPAGVSFNGAPRDQSHWRIERIRAGEGYIWQVPPVASGDGAGGNVAILSSLPVATKGGGWRMVLCSEAPIHDMSASPDDIAKSCMLGLDGPDHGGAKEITGRAVEVEAHDCQRQRNADCVPMPKSRRKTQSIVTISAWELGSGRFLLFLAPPGGTAGKGGDDMDLGWLQAVTLGPPKKEGAYRIGALGADETELAAGTGGWYAPVPVIPGSVIALPAKLGISRGSCEGGSEPLFWPAVLQAPADRWYSGLSEGFLGVEISPGDSVDLWRHQWVSPAIRMWPNAVAVIGDPTCSYTVSVQPDWASWLGDYMRAHFHRIFALSQANIAFASFRVLGGSGDGTLIQALHGNFMSSSFGVYLAAVLHPVAICMSSDCNSCGSALECIIGSSVVQELPDERLCIDGVCAASVPRHRFGWTHRESSLLCILLVLASAGLASLLAGLASLVSRLKCSPPWWLALMGAAFHPFIGGFGSFFILCTAQGGNGNVAVQGAAASVLLSTLMRGPSLVGAGRAVAAEALSDGGAAAGVHAWLVHVWGKGIQFAASAWLDRGVTLILPILCMLIAGGVRQNAAPADSWPTRRVLGLILFVASGLYSIHEGQVAVYTLMWSSVIFLLAGFVSTPILLELSACTGQGVERNDGAIDAKRKRQTKKDL